MNRTFAHYIQRFSERVLQREHLLAMFVRVASYTEVKVRPYLGKARNRYGSDIAVPEDAAILKTIPEGDIFKISSKGVMNTTPGTKPTKVEGYGYHTGDGSVYAIIVPDNQDVPFDLYDEIEVVDLVTGLINPVTSIANATQKPIKTTIGQYLANYCLLANVFGKAIPYQTDAWNIGVIERLIAEGLADKTYSMEQYHRYINNGYYLGHFAELCVPTLTEKSFTTDPNIPKRKAELMERYKGQLNDPNIIALIEDELITMDKAWLEGDDSIGFLDGVGKKAWNTHRKKMLLTVGGVEEFSNDGGSFEFVNNSLAEGMTKESFPAVVNDLRKGSYSRGKETAKGGAMTKFILRVFQDVVIAEDDCGTKRYLEATLTKAQLKLYIGRSVFVGKRLTLITPDNLNSFADKPIKLRAVTECEGKHGFCYTCAGDRYRKLGIEAIGPMAVALSSKFMTASLKQMHVSGITIKNIDYEEFFI